MVRGQRISWRSRRATLQVSPGNEAHLHAFATDAIGLPATGRPLYLHTSPEFACKKLLAAGERRIFDFAHVYRNRERGPLHHPEFTMLEWYRADEPYEALMRDCAALLALGGRDRGSAELTCRGRDGRSVRRARAPDRRRSLRPLRRHRSPGHRLAGRRDRPRRIWPQRCRAAGIRVAEDDTWADVFSRVLVERIEPHLGFGRPTILCEYPISEAALARPTARDPRVAERFELYACGVELANAFGELTDPAEQRRRFEAEMAEKARVYGERYPLDEDFLAALAICREASGIALGFDRLVMLATGAPGSSR